MHFYLTLFLALQATVINNPAKTLYDKIFNEQRPAERLKLINEFETKYASAGSPKLANPQMKAQVFGFATDIFEQQKNGPKMVEYGEKTLQNDPENLHVLVLLAHQYALSGDKANVGVDYARRALTVIDKLRKGKVESGFTKQTWDQYLNSNQASAQATLDYVRSATQRLAVTGRRPSQ
jgi:hypothetical protein